MSLFKASGLYRFVASTVRSWSERAVEEQDALDALRTHPGLAQLQDVLDSEERAVFRRWRELPAGSPEVASLHAEAKAFLRLTAIIHTSLHAKVSAETAESEIRRQMDLQKIDKQRHDDVRQRLAARITAARNGADFAGKAEHVSR